MLWSSGSSPDMEPHSVRERYLWYLGFLRSRPKRPSGFLAGRLSCPADHLSLENVQRQSPTVQKLVMESPNIKTPLHPQLCLGSEFSYLQLAHFVCECLSRPGDVPVYFGDNVLLGAGCVVLEELDCVVSRPFQTVNARIHYQA